MPTCLESVNSMAFIPGGSCKPYTASFCSTTGFCLLPSAAMLPFCQPQNKADLTGYACWNKAVFRFWLYLYVWVGIEIQRVSSLLYCPRMKWTKRHFVSGFCAIIAFDSGSSRFFGEPFEWGRMLRRLHKQGLDIFGAALKWLPR